MCCVKTTQNFRPPKTLARHTEKPLRRHASDQPHPSPLILSIRGPVDTRIRAVDAVCHFLHSNEPDKYRAPAYTLSPAKRMKITN